MNEPERWLVVIDPQVIFADPSSDWASPFFNEAMERIQQLTEAWDDRVLVTRWVPGTDRPGSWADYFAAWPFADRPAHDALFDLVPAAQSLTTRATIDRPTFGKWGEDLARVTGPTPRLTLTGVSTDCCVLSTALAAADAGAHVEVVSDACAGSTAENHAAALQVMGLYPPQITVTDTATVLARRS